MLLLGSDLQADLSYQFVFLFPFLIDVTHCLKLELGDKVFRASQAMSYVILQFIIVSNGHIQLLKIKLGSLHIPFPSGAGNR